MDEKIYQNSRQAYEKESRFSILEVEHRNLRNGPNLV
jgi:hypothetical protein